MRFWIIVNGATCVTGNPARTMVVGAPLTRVPCEGPPGLPLAGACEIVRSPRCRHRRRTWPVVRRALPANTGLTPHSIRRECTVVATTLSLPVERVPPDGGGEPHDDFAVSATSRRSAILGWICSNANELFAVGRGEAFECTLDESRFRELQRTLLGEGARAAEPPSAATSSDDDGSGCDCGWTNNRANCRGSGDGSVCWRACCG